MQDRCSAVVIGLWCRLVDRIFGSQPALGENDPTGRHGDPSQPPVESVLEIRPARVPIGLRERLVSGDPRLRQALTFVKPGIKIDRRSGSAQTNFLRFEELARKGMILEADCRLRIPESLARETASALLIGSAMLVERLGGKRRRGSGLCRIEILDANVTAALDWLERTTVPPEWPSGGKQYYLPAIVSSSKDDDSWLCIPLFLRLQEPLAISCRTVGNVVSSLDFVPGSYLLPHVTRTIEKLGVNAQLVIQAGDLCVLPAYPEIDDERGQPVPIALFAPKGISNPFDKENRNRVMNRLLQTDPPEDTQFKQIREGYISSGPREVYRTPIVVRTHNTVEDHHQRPAETVGGVYTYEAIAADDGGRPMVLCSELRVRKSLADQLEEHAREWWRTLAGEISVGRSKKDDYGLVRLEVGDPYPFVSQYISRDDSLLFVWLVSDAILRNLRLRAEPTAAALGEELTRLLGVKLTVRRNCEGLLDELVRVRRFDTWHVKWGLPRPSLISLQAGSCMVFHVEGIIDGKKVAQLEASGIGERTAEGFGQVRFNHPLLICPPSDWPKRENSQARRADAVAVPSPQEMDEVTQKFAHVIETECWRQEIRRACLKIAANKSRRRDLLGWNSDTDSPPMSQLGGLRGQLAVLRGLGDKDRIIEWLEHLEANKRRAEKWPSIAKVKEFIQSDSRIWEVIEAERFPTLTDDGKASLKSELWAFAVRMFFDACIRAHKREVEVTRGA